MNEKKTALRQALAAAERAMDREDKRIGDEAIAAHILASEVYRTAGTVFCFVGRENEINTRPILSRALADGKRLCVPLSREKGGMELRRIETLSCLTVGRCGIPEPPETAPIVWPEEVDLALIPCVGADRSGHRLGWGGGYYDRFLAGYPGCSVLLCREAFVREDIPKEEHDLPALLLVTEQGFWPKENL